ncbi:MULTISPECIES: hypothetical protein [Desulfosediminicola]|uniref:hypothetical protein n=1 Tax=Desulfosediminicola TaxID=2886823 RepID=UPI0010AD72F7|nr:hypothetical protein [Desulfosediminicola ganghwensis]
MAQQKHSNSNSNPKEQLIVAFVLVSSMLIMTDVGMNLAEEIRITSELKTISTELTKPQPKIEPTLSGEELQEWTERLKKQSDT